MAKPNQSLAVAELPSQSDLIEQMSDSTRTLLLKCERKLNSAVLQRSEIMREIERTDNKLNGIKEYKQLTSRKRELQRDLKAISNLIDSVGFTINETIVQELDHVPGRTLTEKAQSIREGKKS